MAIYGVLVQKERIVMVDNILLFLWGTLFGYLLATFQIAKLLVKKGYRRFDEIPDND
jgi:hypothetical protein